MSVQSKIAQWRHVGRFFAQRVSDYGELFRIELAETKSRLLHEVVALVARHALFPCRSLGRRWHLGDRDRGHFFVARTRYPAQPFQTFQSELQRDLQAIKEATK